MRPHYLNSLGVRLNGKFVTPTSLVGGAPDKFVKPKDFRKAGITAVLFEVDYAFNYLQPGPDSIDLVFLTEVREAICGFSLPGRKPTKINSGKIRKEDQFYFVEEMKRVNGQPKTFSVTIQKE